MVESYYFIMPFHPKGRPGRGLGGNGGGWGVGWTEQERRSMYRMRELWWCGIQPNRKLGADAEIVSIVMPPPPCLLFFLTLPCTTEGTQKHVHNICSDLPFLSQQRFLWSTSFGLISIAQINLNLCVPAVWSY